MNRSESWNRYTLRLCDKEVFSIGIIGAGDIVNRVHLPVLAATDRVRIKWIADVDPVRARLLARLHKATDVLCGNELDKLPDADVILLAIPFGARRPYYEVLRNRPCALYVEKPFSRSVKHHQTICSWFSDHKLAVGFHRRSWGPTLLIKDAIEERLFGELRGIDYGFGGPGIVVSGKYNSDLALAGGGILFETAVHGIDALLFVSSAIDINSTEIKMISEEGFDLHTSARFKIETERNGTVDCKMTISCLQETSEELSFVFDNAVVSYSLFGDGEISVTPLNGGRKFRLTTATAVYPETVYQTVHDHWCRFLDGVDSSEPNWTSACNSILTTTVVEALYNSDARVTSDEELVTECR